MAEAGGCGGAGSASGELVGIAIGTVAQFLISLGLCGMKWAHKRNAALPAAARSSRYVVAAFSLNALGGLLNGVALSLASQSEIGALGTLVLVGNCIFAPRLLGEVVGPREVRGTLVILLSTVVVVLSGPHCEAAFDSALLLFLLIRPLHLAFALLTALLIGGSWSLVNRAEAALLAGMRGVSDEDLEAATPLSASSEQHNPLRLSVDRQLSADLAEDRTSSLQSSSPPTSPIADSAGWDELLDARREEQYELRSVSGRRLAAAHISTCAAFSCYNIIFTKIVGEAHRPLCRLRKALPNPSACWGHRRAGLRRLPLGALRALRLHLRRLPHRLQHAAGRLAQPLPQALPRALCHPRAAGGAAALHRHRRRGECFLPPENRTVVWKRPKP